MRGQPDGLIGVLLDPRAEFGDRDDAAMDLGSFDDACVEQALAQIACDFQADCDLADSCGESLAEIWCRKDRIDCNILKKLVPASLTIAVVVLRTNAPHLAAQAEEIFK
ncbi:MAG: hypothetical protein ABL907_25485 [Hyphomicrobium sp.]